VGPAGIAVEQGGDRAVGHFVHEVRLHVVAAAIGHDRVNRTLDGDVGLDALRSSSGSASRLEGCQDGGAILGRTRVHTGHDDGLRVVQRRGYVGIGQNGPEHKLGRDTLRKTRRNVSPHADDSFGVVVGIYDLGDGDIGSDRMEAEFERGDHAETAAAAASGPEQVDVLVAAGPAHASVRVTISIARRLWQLRPWVLTGSRTRLAIQSAWLLGVPVDESIRARTWVMWSASGGSSSVLFQSGL
jgi:hypothetical protein